MVTQSPENKGNTNNTGEHRNTKPHQYSKLLNFQTSYNPILEASFLKVKESSFKRDQTRIFRLYSESLAYFKPSSEEPIGEIPLAKIISASIVIDPNHKSTTFLEINFGTESFKLSSASKAQLKIWALKIEELKGKIKNWYYFTNCKNKIIEMGNSGQFWKIKTVKHKKESIGKSDEILEVEDLFDDKSEEVNDNGGVKEVGEEFLNVKYCDREIEKWLEEKLGNIK